MERRIPDAEETHTYNLYTFCYFRYNRKITLLSLSLKSGRRVQALRLFHKDFGAAPEGLLS